MIPFASGSKTIGVWQTLVTILLTQTICYPKSMKSYIMPKMSNNKTASGWNATDESPECAKNAADFCNFSWEPSV